ncbi:MAG: chemotaxis-specific protein-glutamate methyltransferase CheB [Anaerolineae bacterium]|nr:chemotaxis-specific protein-glutamate methyltransferase CheB [Anaerolineae bacterium]
MNRESKGIRVVVVDDSPTVRQLLVAILQDEPGMHVVGTGANGEDAVHLTRQLRPDVVTMDVRMPRMDGLQATREIMREVPTPIVIVTGNLVHADVDITFEALRAGALTVVRTPGLADPEGCAGLIRTVRLMAGVPVVHHWAHTVHVPDARPAPVLPSAPPAVKSYGAPKIVGMAASTGGPGAIASILRHLPADYAAPILVVQHVAAGFVAGLAEWLDSQTPLHVTLANHGDRPQPGTVLIAPDDYHLQINMRGIVELCREPPYKGLRPSANHLFHSLASAYGPAAIGIILTGMGDDGAEGLHALHQVGGLTVAQDEATCVVYGMPHQAVVAGGVERSLSPDGIARLLVSQKVPSPVQPPAPVAHRAHDEEDLP